MFNPPSSRSPLRTLPFFIAMAIVFIGVSLLSTDASAEHRQRDIDVEFRRLDASVHHGEISVEYAITHEDWRAVRDARINPRLNLYTRQRGRGFEFAYSVPLNHRRGTVTFPARVTPRRLSAVQLRASGRHGRSRIARTEYGSACADRIQIAVHRPAPRRHRPRHHTPPRPSYATLVRACGPHTYSSGEVNSCAARAMKIDYGAEAAIDACGKATHWTNDFLSCLDRSVALRNPARTIEACDDATHWSNDFDQCLQNAGKFRADAVPAIRACSDATHWTNDFQQCLTSASNYHRDAAPVVRACADATHWTNDFQQCLASGHS